MTAGVYQAAGRRATGEGWRAGLFGALALLALLAVRPLPAQDTTRVAITVGSGRVTGRVTSRISGQPLPFVLVSLDRPRTNLFSTEQGRFTLPDLGKGEHRMFVRQLGFEPLLVMLAVTEGGPQEIELALEPRALQLPTLVASACLPVGELEPGLRSVLAAASENARRLDLMQREYPYAGQYQKVTEVFSRDGGRLSRTSSLEEWQFWTSAYYKPGKAIMPGRVPGTNDVAWFTATALLAEDFRKTHCFRFGGADSTDPVSPLVTIEFEPLASLKGPDWEGKVTLDQRGVLRRSEAHLVAKKPKDSWPAAVACEVSYDAVGGSLPVESVLICRTRAAEPWVTVRLEEWRLVCQRFVKKIPGVESGFLADSSGAWQGRMCSTVNVKR
jgi:hypothetical protein